MYNFNDITTALVINSIILMSSDFESTFLDVKKSLEKEKPVNEYDELVKKISFAFINNIILSSYQPFEMSYTDLVKVANAFQTVMFDEEVSQLAISCSTWWSMQEKAASNKQSSSYDLFYGLLSNNAFEKNLLPTALFVSNYCAMRINSAPIVVNYGVGQALQNYADMHAKIRLRALVENSARLRTYLSDDYALGYNIWACLVHFAFHYRDPKSNADVYKMKVGDYTVTVSQAISTTDWTLGIMRGDKYVGSLKYSPTVQRLYPHGGLTIDVLDEVWNLMPELGDITAVSEMTAPKFDSLFSRILTFGVPAITQLRSDTSNVELTVGAYTYRAVQQSSVRTIIAYQGRKIVALFDCDSTQNVFYNPSVSEDMHDSIVQLADKDLKETSSITLEDAIYKYIVATNLTEASPKVVVNAIGHLLNSFEVPGLDDFKNRLLTSFES